PRAGWRLYLAKESDRQRQGGSGGSERGSARHAYYVRLDVASAAYAVGYLRGRAGKRHLQDDRQRRHVDPIEKWLAEIGYGQDRAGDFTCGSAADLGHDWRRGRRRLSLR